MMVEKKEPKKARKKKTTKVKKTAKRKKRTANADASEKVSAVKQVSIEEVQVAAATDVAPKKKAPARRKRKKVARAKATKPSAAPKPSEVAESSPPLAPMPPTPEPTPPPPREPAVPMTVERDEATATESIRAPAPRDRSEVVDIPAPGASAVSEAGTDTPRDQASESEAGPRRPRRRRRRRGGGGARSGDAAAPTADAPPKERGTSRPAQPERWPTASRTNESDDPASSDVDDRASTGEPVDDAHASHAAVVTPRGPAGANGQPLARAPRRRGGKRTVGGGARVTEEPDNKQVAAKSAVRRELLINVTVGDECRIAVVKNNRLEELFIERTASQSHVGNIYKGRVTNIEPSIQAAFIDFGLQANGFLHISDVQPQYFPDHKGVAEEVGRKIPRMHRPPIQNCFRRGQEVVVQVTKEGVGTKGPTLTTYLSIPGRYLVMMPGMSRHGVSRKIEDDAERRTMRDLLRELKLPSGMGFILRTAGMGRTKREIQRDLTYLTRLWKIVADRIKNQPTPAELYQESDLVTRTIRDVYTTDFQRIVVDSSDTAKRIREFLEIALPRTKVHIDVYTDREPLFHRFRLEQEIERIYHRQVPLASGGSLVIDSTEALVAIDVNSGRSRGTDDAEEMAYNINMEAAEEIARQLRLRDLGGLIICDFIDMRADRHKRDVEHCLRDALKDHKERARILRLSGFGLIEMTRQRRGPSMKRNLFFDCPHCKGAGLVKMSDSVILDVMRVIQLAVNHRNVERMTVTVSPQVAYQILNAQRTVLATIEDETGKQVTVLGDASFTSDQVVYLCEDARGQLVNVLPAPPAPRRGRRR